MSRFGLGPRLVPSTWPFGIAGRLGLGRSPSYRYNESLKVKNVWIELGKVKVPVSSQAAYFTETFYISRKLFTIQKDPVCFNCRGKRIDCSSGLLCHDIWHGPGQAIKTIIEIDYKKEILNTMKFHPYSQKLFNSLGIR